MTKYFEIFDKNLKLTSKQLQDAKKKYNNVYKTLHARYYSLEYDRFISQKYKHKTISRGSRYRCVI